MAEIVHQCTVPIQIDELHEEGRLSSYILESRIGMQIKHSTQRLHPWSFTFTKRNVQELVDLRAIFSKVYVVLVCRTDGMLCIDLPEFIQLLAVGDSEQAWLRVDRRKGKWYEVNGSKTQGPRKYPKGIDALMDALGFQGAVERPAKALQT
ncbi:hypothetical protein NKH16_30435 [Mesorhizobium sp. M1307]|uniref:hypothetical protein n=1 Tax=unclassified Mesorhizobium TaxID=325217 RepID=UPI003339F8DE